VIENSNNFYGQAFKYKNDLYISKDGLLTKWDGNTFTTYQNNIIDYSFGEFLFEYKGIAYCVFSKTIANSDDNFGEVKALISFDGNQLKLAKDGFEEIWEFIEYRDTLFFSELSIESWDQSFNLIKFDGENFHQICKLGDNNIHSIQPIIYHDTLFFRIKNNSGIYQLAKYCSGKTQIIENPDEGFLNGGYSSENPMIINNSLYIIYDNIEGLSQFAKYNNNQLEFIENPDKGPIFMVNSIHSKDTVYFNYRNEHGKFLLAYFDGKSIKLLPQYDDGLQMFTEPIVFNDALYFTYFSTNKQAQLLKVDVNKIIVVGKIDEAFSNLNTPNIAKNVLYYRIQTDVSTYNLVKFDGKELKILDNPDDKTGYYDPESYIFNDTLFFLYRGNEGTLAFCGGEKVELVKDIPNGMTEDGFFDFNNKLYFRYYYNLKDYIATFNYKSSEIITQAEDEKLIKNEPVAFPNPVGNKLHIKNCENCSEVNILNNQGQTIFKTKFNENMPIDFEPLPTGIYFIKIKHNDDTTTKFKILKINN
jgi:hypothetical protein